MSELMKKHEMTEEDIKALWMYCPDKTREKSPLTYLAATRARHETATAPFRTRTTCRKSAGAMGFRRIS